MSTEVAVPEYTAVELFDDEKLEPWHRGGVFHLTARLETEQAFEAFEGYLAMPPGRRSLRKACALAGRSPALYGDWSRTHRWVDRCEAYDRHMYLIAQASRERSVREMGTRHARLARNILSKAAVGLRNIDPSELSAGELAKLVEVAVKVERLSRGEASQVTGVQGVAGKPIRLEQEAAATKQVDSDTLKTVLASLIEAGALGELTMPADDDDIVDADVIEDSVDDDDTGD